uniref:Uncharacterized protein n=1 Tax=Myoviridae sp. ctQVY25 TaxID=2827687 RepID=A0A8S5SJP4_9CAUD|nr:MAG TPA: hypothetical protein [Myoviridae sp. ctQVY25]DAW81377.1 MAG TPA: hypothetical protein [Caudoviricetes sp.]
MQQKKTVPFSENSLVVCFFNLSCSPHYEHITIYIKSRIQ